MPKTIAIVAAVLGGCLLGCDDDDEPATDASVDSASAAPFTIATYNAGLLPSVGYVEERLPPVLDAVAKLDAQVLCVQEVWETEHWDALVAANDPPRSNVLRIADDPGAAGLCSPDSFDPLEACAAPACAGAADLVPCVTANCAMQVGELDSGCIQCLLANAESGDFDAIRAACVGGGAGADAGVLPPEERSYISGGSYGVGLLSSLPIAEHDVKTLDASTVRRGILYARLDDTALGTVHVFCTHLGAILKDVRYEGSYGGWEGENAAHTEALLDYVSEKVGQGEQVIVLGDLNNGPKGEDIEASEPMSYAMFGAAGFQDPFLEGPNASCTFCADNPLVQPDDEGAQAAIDHILTRDTKRVASVERILDEPVDIEVEIAAGGVDAGTADSGAMTVQRRVGLSDHYGLRATFGE